MKSVRVTGALDDLLDPAAAAWRRAPSEALALTPTPVVLQPSEYVQVKWGALKHGTLPEVRAASTHNGEAICFRLEWEDATRDDGIDDMANFPDQAGVMLPLKDDAPITEMGLPDQPVNMWLWRADLETPNYVTANGRGTAVRHKDSPLQARASWSGGTWQVVIARPFNVPLAAEFIVPLAPGMQHKCTFAVWQGAGKERGGLKAYVPLWQPLEIEA